MGDEAITTPTANAAAAPASAGESAAKSTPSLQEGVMAKLANRQPGLGKVVEKWKPATDGGSLPKNPDPDKAGGGATDEPGDKATAPEEEDDKAGEDTGAEAGDSDENEDADEIQDGDTIEQQLAKLQKGQKKTLKRVDKLTQDKRELERQLAEERAKQGGAGNEPAEVDTALLADVTDLAGLETRVGEIRNYLKQLSSAPAGGLRMREANGEEREMAPEEIAQHVVYWSEVLAEQVPARRAFLETAEKSKAEAADKFKPWQDKKDFTEARATVEKGMKKIASVIPDYDLALNERALGRMVLSGAYELVPKRKAAAGAGANPPAKKAAPTPPANPPGNSGPPVRPAGQGPNLEELKQRMLKNPGNKDATKAYVTATLNARRVG